MKKHLILFSSVLVLGAVALTIGGTEVGAEKVMDVKVESAASVDADPVKFNVNGVVYTITENTNEAVITSHIKNGLPEVVTINEKITDPTTKIQYTVTGIGTGALGLGTEETDIVKEISVPKTVLKIGNSAFSGRTKLENVKLSDGVTSIGSYAFTYATSLKSIIIPNSVKTIGDAAFLGASSLSNVALPNGLVALSTSLFRDCISLKTINIPNSVSFISYHVFTGSGLTKIAMPTSLVKREDLSVESFYGDYIEEITFTSSIVNGIYSNVFKAPIKEGYIFEGWANSEGTTYQSDTLSIPAETGNITLTAKWKQDTATPKPSTGVSDATIKLLEKQEVGAVSFGAIATDAKMVFDEIILDGTSKTTSEQTASKIKVTDTRANKNTGWKVGVNYKDTNYIDKKMNLTLNGTSTNASVVSNVSLDKTKKDLFTGGTAKASSYEVKLNPTLTIPADFKAVGNQTTQVEWTLEMDVQ